MAPKSTFKLTPRALIAAAIDKPLFIDDHACVPEPPIEDRIINIWYSDAPIPYSILGTIFAFMGPFPRCVKKPYIMKYFFPSYPSFEPSVFWDQPFDFIFFKNRVFQ